MIYIIVRLIILGIMSIAPIIRRRNKKGGSKAAITIIIIILISMIVYLVPFENCIMTFSSVENAYRYVGTGNIRVAVDGKTSTFVLASKNKGTKVSVHVFLKTENGWKLCNGLDIKLVSATVSGDYTIQIYRYKNTSEYYTILSNKNNSPVAIVDKYGTNYIGFSINDRDEQYSYCGYIYDLSIPYSVIINGTPITFGF